VAEDVAAVGAADGVFGLVDTGDEHAGEDDKGEDHEDEAADELKGPEEGFSFDPCLDDPVAVFAARFGGKTLATDEGALFADEGF